MTLDETNMTMKTVTDKTVKIYQQLVIAKLHCGVVMLSLTTPIPLLDKMLPEFKEVIDSLIIFAE